MKCIDQVYTAEESWDASDCTKKELKDFVESMNSKQFKDIEKFFDTMPKLQHKVEVFNPKTKVKSEVMLEGLASFSLRLWIHESLENYYRTNFALMQHHKYSLTELENMIPWEREIYVSLLQQYIEEENLKAQQRRGSKVAKPKPKIKASKVTSLGAKGAAPKKKRKTKEVTDT